MRRRALRARRVGMLIRWVRIVALVALAWKASARTPAVRVRLCPIAQRVAQAALAWNDARVAGGPGRRLSRRR